MEEITEFDCPVCMANNPIGDPVGVGEEVFCLFCMSGFKVVGIEDGKPLLEEL